MKLIRRYVIPLLLIGLGIWIIADKQTSLTILGIVMVALSAVTMTLNVTNREMPKLVKIGYCVIDGAIGACGIFVLVAPAAANRIMQYLIGGIIVIYAGVVLWELIRKKADTPFIILEALAVAMGLALIFIQWADSFFPIAAGSALAFTGLATLLGRIFGRGGKPKVVRVQSTPVNVPENPAAEPVEAAGSETGNLPADSGAAAGESVPVSGTEEIANFSDGNTLTPGMEIPTEGSAHVPADAPVMDNSTAAGTDPGEESMPVLNPPKIDS